MTLFWGEFESFSFIPLVPFESGNEEGRVCGFLFLLEGEISEVVEEKRKGVRTVPSYFFFFGLVPSRKAGTKEQWVFGSRHSRQRDFGFDCFSGFMGLEMNRSARVLFLSSPVACVVERLDVFMWVRGGKLWLWW